MFREERRFGCLALRVRAAAHLRRPGFGPRLRGDVRPDLTGGLVPRVKAHHNALRLAGCASARAGWSPRATRW